MRDRTETSNACCKVARLAELIEDAYVSPPVFPTDWGTMLATDPFAIELLRARLLQSAKPRAQWQVGLEYEVIGYDSQTLTRIDQSCVQSLLRSFTALGGSPQYEHCDIVAVEMPYGNITLEPGGQLEFSGKPARALRTVEINLRQFLQQLHVIAQQHKVFFIALGFDPLRRLNEQFWINKRRYQIMRPYLRTRGGYAWDMMTRTAAIQVSIDFSDEADLAKKFVLGNRLGPIIAAMFANSPFADGRITGLRSTRYAAWLDTDPDRTGPAPGTLDDSFNLHDFIRASLEVPAFFIAREDGLRDYAGLRLHEIPEARTSDFEDLLSMIFTEARLRKYIELRSADSGSPEATLALMALWKGLTYDSKTLQRALEVTPRLDYPAYRALQMAIAKKALDVESEGVSVAEVAREIVRLAIAGLSTVAPDEVHYLDGLAALVIDRSVSPADALLADSTGDARKAAALATVA